MMGGVFDDVTFEEFEEESIVSEVSQVNKFIRS